MALGLVIPVVIQDTVSNVVNLLDNNVMVGRLGTAHLSGVAIANQLMFVYHLSVFGVLAGAGIYGAVCRGQALAELPKRCALNCWHRWSSRACTCHPHLMACAADFSLSVW